MTGSRGVAGSFLAFRNGTRLAPRGPSTSQTLAMARWSVAAFVRRDDINHGDRHDRQRGFTMLALRRSRTL